MANIKGCRFQLSKLQILRSCVAMAMGLVMHPVMAQVYELSYTDTNAAVVVKKPDATWYNPNGTIIVTAISGLDRRVKLELLSGTTVIQTSTSGVITVANRIVASDGNAFYGTKFNLSKPSDGNYILRSTVYDLNGVQVSSNDYTFNVDTVGPTASGTYTFTVGAATGGQIDVFGIDRAGNAINHTGIVDARSGVVTDDVSYFTIDSSGVKREAATTLTTGSTSTWNVKADWAAQKALAPSQGLYTIGLAVKDKAGNLSKITRQSYIDSVYPSYSVEVWNSVAAAWQPAASATSYQNPIKFRFKIPRANHVSYNGTNYGYVNAATNTDASYAYIEYSTVIPQPASRYWRLTTKSGLYSDVQGPMFDSVTLSGAQWAPRITDFSYGLLVNGVSQPMVDNVSVRRSAAATINRLTVYAETRSYPQLIEVNGTSCTIATGGTNCTLNPAISFSSGKGYVPYGIQGTNVNNTALSSFGGYLYTYWDFNPPVIDTFTHDPANKNVTMEVTDNDRVDTWQLSVWDTKSLSAKAVNSANQPYTLPQTLYKDVTYKQKIATFSTSGLPDGVYTLTATATDIDGNAASKSIASQLVDSVGPVISASHKGTTSFDNVQTIKDLRFTITDNHDTSPVMSSLVVSGGPINDSLTLGFTKRSDGWSPEVPRMFPTLEPGQEYQVTATARDSHGNESTKSVTITLSPSNLVRHDAINLLPVTQSLLDINDKALGVISFQGALTDGGSQSRGPQVGYFTLRRDAEFSVMFNGTKVEPGETKDVVIPLNAEGYVTLPVWPANADVIGKATYMIDIPQLTAN
ncbi:Ig-like domain-containing protein [Aeromonas enteropelogenes]|uniref:Ig-like domain-containing protein n=1 Tax=Aeromonas enteropelogenes TaxID=29489 RepID=UPI003F7B06A6